MSEYYYDTFDCNIHSEEIYSTDPEEMAEVMRLMAEDNFEGYGEWSEQIEAHEQAAWAGAVPVDTPNGQILVKPQCDRKGAHRNCTIYKCKRAHREGGFDL